MALLVAGNSLVLVGLVLALLIGLSAFGDAFNLYRSYFPKRDPRADLPAYADRDHALRVFEDQRGAILTYVPFVEWRREAKTSATLNIDAEGRRLHTIGTDNRPGAVTLGVFGGSTVWGTGVDDNGTLPAQLDAITDTYIVRNYGEGAYTSFQNLIDLIQELNRNKAPKIVIFLEGFNDVWVHCNGAVTRSLMSHMQEKRIQSALDRTAKESYLYNNIIAPILVLWPQFVIRAEEAVIPLCTGNPARAEAVAETIVRTFELAESLARSNGGKFYAFLQPNAYIGRPRVDHLPLNREHEPLLRGQFEAIYRIVRAKMKQRAASWFFDLSDAFDTGDYLLIDDAHVTQAGNRLLAEAIKARIAQ